MTDAQINNVVLGETYPILLLNDARELAKAAADGGEKRADERAIPSPEERATARAAIFTAFNLLECLLIELTQDKINKGPTRCRNCDTSILDELKSGRASISRTMTDWPVKVLGICITHRAEFGKFKEIRTLRNQLIHPKLETLEKGERSQDDLLKECNADRCKEVLYEVARMCKVLYCVYGQNVPREFDDVLNEMRS